MNKVIKASAGTGKTYRLSLEYLASLLNEVDFSEIIVMTFTKKATAEIRERIFSHIKAILNDSKEKKEIISALKDIYPELSIDRELLKEIYKKMILNDEDIHIYTIDSFSNRIFAGGIAPYLGIYNHKIIDDNQNQELMEELLKEILNNEEYYNKMENFLQENVERDLESYLDFVKNIVENYWKFILLNKAKKEKIETADKVQLFDRTIEILRDTAAVKSEELSEKYFVKDSMMILNHYISLKRKESKDQFLYSNRDYLLNNCYWNGNQFRGKKKADLKKEIKEVYDEFRKNMAVEIYNNDVLAAESELIKFSKLILEIYDSIKMKKGEFTHSDISNYTFKFLNEEELSLIKDGQPTDFLLEVLGGDYKALYIDEFQDTSILQWKILKPLIDYADDFIAVGDEKQSIYGWRGGEKKLFASLTDILDADSEELKLCYRSDKEIIEFINSFFENTENDWEYSSVNANSDKSGYQEVVYGGSSAYYNTNTKSFEKLAEEKQKEIEILNSKITGDLKSEIAENIKKNYQDYSKVNILARTSRELNEIAEALIKNNIPYLLENRSSLLDDPLVSAVYDFLYFNAYGDFYSLLKFLRSDLIKLPNSRLKILFKMQDKIKRYFCSANEMDLHEELHLSNSEIELFKTLKEVKESEYEDLISYIFEDLLVNSEIKKSDAQIKNLYTFFEILKSKSFLIEAVEYLKDNRESDELKQKRAESSGSVRLMTVHQAKGLSLPVVYFYWSPGSRKGNSTEAIKFYLDFDENYDEVNNYLFIQNKHLDILDWLDYDFKEREEQKEEMEEINNLYVALTRAEKSLHLFVESPRKIDPDKEFMWEGSSYDYYEKMLLSGTGVNDLTLLLEGIENGELCLAEKEITHPEIKIPPLNHYFRRAKLKNEDGEFDDINTEFDHEMETDKLKLAENRLKGLALHYFLEQIKYGNDRELENAYQLLNSKYGDLLGKEGISKIRRRAEKFIRSNPRLFEEKYQIFTEYILKDEANTFRIDRLIVDKSAKKIKIIDYKSGYTRDREQLENYKRVLEKKLDQSWDFESIFVNI